MNISIGDAQNGKRKVEDIGNPKNFPHVKAYGKHYGGKIAAALMSIVLIIQLVTLAVDFWCSEPKMKRNNDRRR